MEWTVLVDNRTNDPALQTEHGLSIFLKTERYRILLDTGARQLGMFGPAAILRSYDTSFL